MATEKRKLGLFMLIALVSGNMLGSGVFLLPASLAEIGSITMISWLLTSLGSIMLALLFARMSLLVPKAGGPYVFASRGFGYFIGFQAAYSYWVALWVGNAAIALAAVAYMQAFFPSLRDSTLTAITAIGLVWFFTFVNIMGARVAGWFQVISFLCKIMPLLIIMIMGWWYFHPEYLSQGFNVSHHSDSYAISHGAVLTLWAFVGLESATVSAERAANPARDVPIATVLGTIIAAVIYMVSSYVIMGMIPMHTLAQSSSPFALAARIVLGPWGGVLVTAGAIISCLGALNGWILLQGQVAMNASRDKMFPRLFGQQNQHSVPQKGLLVTSVLVSLLLFFTMSSNLIKQFDLIILLANLAMLIPYFYTAMAYFVVNHRWGGKFSAYFYLLVSLLAGVYSYWAILGAGQVIVYWGLLFILTSFPLYVLSQREHQVAFSKQ